MAISRQVPLVREYTVAEGVCLLRVDCWSGGDRRLVAYYTNEGFTPLEEIERLSGYAVQLVAATARDIKATLQTYLPDDKVFVIDEINTHPGFTKISMYPRLWALSGVPLPALVGRLVDHALARHRDRTRLDRGIKGFLASLI